MHYIIILSKKSIETLKLSIENELILAVKSNCSRSYFLIGNYGYREQENGLKWYHFAIMFRPGYLFDGIKIRND